MENNAKTIRELRWDKRLTQTDLARRAGVTNVSICNYEAGKSVPSGPTLQRLARVLGVDANDIDLSYADREAAA